MGVVGATLGEVETGSEGKDSPGAGVSEGAPGARVTSGRVKAAAIVGDAGAELQAVAASTASNPKETITAFLISSP
jgi:hypothetical protein